MQPSSTLRAFVLAGGRSSRLGRDKALLTLTPGGETLLERIARVAAQATGRPSTILGDPQRYGHLGLDVLPDLVPGQGPMSGLHAALSATDATWNLLLACDLPYINAAFLEQLLSRTTRQDNQALCVAAETESGVEPLCAVYHRNTLAAVAKALAEGRLRMRSLAVELGAVTVPAPPGMLDNLNTERDWQRYQIENTRRSA